MVWLCMFAAALGWADGKPMKYDIVFEIERFTNKALYVREDGARPWPDNRLVDDSKAVAANLNRPAATMDVVHSRLQIKCPSNGCYSLKMKVDNTFEPGCNYLWTVSLWQRPLPGRETREAMFRYTLREETDEDGTRLQGFSVTKRVPLKGGGYRPHTFVISMPPGADARRRVLDLEITNVGIEKTGGIIKFLNMELKRERLEREVLDVWPSGTPPGHEQGLPNQEYIWLGRYYCDISRPTLTVYRPADTNREPVGVILCSGGSFQLLEPMDKDAAWLNSLGITAFELKYRVPAKPAIALQDAQRALRLVRSKAEAYGITRQGIMGGSAGSHLALMAATQFDRDSYEPMDEIDKLSCRPDFVISIASPYVYNGDGTRNKDIRITNQTPPVFLAHGDADKHSAVNSAAVYIDLRKRRIPAELHIWSKAGHGISVTSDIGRQWSRLCAQWLKTLGFIDPDEPEPHVP